MKAQEVSNSLWATATLKEDVPDVLNGVPTLVAQVPAVAKDMNAQCVSNSLWAAATLKEAAPDILKGVPAFVAQVRVIAKDMKAQEVANSLFALVLLSDSVAEVEFCAGSCGTVLRSLSEDDRDRLPSCCACSCLGLCQDGSAP